MSPHAIAPVAAALSQVAHSDLHLKALLDKYLGRSVANYILNEASNPHERVVYASVLFADIRDFTALAEATEDRALYREVNAYYETLDAVISDYGGVINDFGGDSILALFGAPNKLIDHAAAALHAAVDIMTSLVDLNAQRERNARPPFRVGIGVNSGQMVMGNFGSRTRQTFTVIGDCVNSAKRLSDLSKDTPFYSIFASQQTLSDTRTTLPRDWVIYELGDKQVRGKQKSVTTFAITPSEFD